MPDLPFLLVLIVLVALVFDFTNGAHDSANAIATVVSTKVLSPRTAVGMAAVLNLGGALLGDEVAATLGKGVVNPEVVAGSQVLVLAALVGAIGWNLITWYVGIPSSSEGSSGRPWLTPVSIRSTVPPSGKKFCCPWCFRPWPVFWPVFL